MFWTAPVSIVIALNVLLWPILQIGIAYLITQCPIVWFKANSILYCHVGGELWLYERIFCIHRWKDLLSDGGTFIKGGFEKSKLRSRERHYFERFLS